MPKATTIQGVFNGGEFSDLLKGQTTLQKRAESLEQCQNMIAFKQGPVVRRGGTKFAREVKDSSKRTELIDFQFSSSQVYQIEVGDVYFRFFKDNAIITETAQDITAVTKANPAVLTYNGADNYTNGKEVFITGVVGMTELNGKFFKIANVNTGANTFELNDIDGNNINSSSFTTYSSAGTIAQILEVTSPYTQAQLFDSDGIFQIHFLQSADVLYLFHGSHEPRSLTRTSDILWTLAIVVNEDGPFLPTNTTATTLALSGTSGSVTVTAVGTAGINGGSGFQTTDIGRLIRFKDAAAEWTWLTITARASTTSVTATISGQDASAGTATVNWRLGVWSDTTGWPVTGAFYQDRLTLPGASSYPDRWDMSKTGGYGATFALYAPTEVDGTVSDDNAISRTLPSRQVNAIQWAAEDANGLVLGTTGQEWIVRASSANQVLTPGNAKSDPISSKKSALIQPILAESGLVFVQKSRRKLLDMIFSFDLDRLKPRDITLAAEHITKTQITSLAYQQEPINVIWAVRGDGTLLGLTYYPDEKVFGWHRHIIGGSFSTGQAVVESISVIPSSDGSRDELWMIVKRTINSVTRRYVEYMTRYYEDDIVLEDAFHVDGGLTFDIPLTITAATKADPVVVTSASHGLSNGEYVDVRNVVGMTELNGNRYIVIDKTTNTVELAEQTRVTTISGATQANPVVITSIAHGLSNSDEIAILNVAGMVELNGLNYTVANKTDDTFELSGVNGTGFTTYTSVGDIHNMVNSTSFTTYVSDGELNEAVTTVSGLDHLEGETLKVMRDGKAHPDLTVSSGSVTLANDRRGSIMQFGLSNTWAITTLETNSGAADGSAQGKTKRIHNVVFKLKDTLGLRFGPNAATVDALKFENYESYDETVALFNGNTGANLFPGGYDQEGQIHVTHDGVFPATILALIYQLQTQDR